MVEQSVQVISGSSSSAPISGSLAANQLLATMARNRVLNSKYISGCPADSCSERRKVPALACSRDDARSALAEDANAYLQENSICPARDGLEVRSAPCAASQFILLTMKFVEKSICVKISIGSILAMKFSYYPHPFSNHFLTNYPNQR